MGDANEKKCQLSVVSYLFLSLGKWIVTNKLITFYGFQKALSGGQFSRKNNARQAKEMPTKGKKCDNRIYFSSNALCRHFARLQLLYRLVLSHQLSLLYQMSRESRRGISIPQALKQFMSSDSLLCKSAKSTRS